MTKSFEFGRAQSSPITILDPSVSMRHAKLEQIDGIWYLEDLGATNGTFVNGTRIERKEVFEGDVIHLGTAKFVFVDGSLRKELPNSSATQNQNENHPGRGAVMLGQRKLVIALSSLGLLLVASFIIRVFPSSDDSVAIATKATVFIVASDSRGEDCWIGSGFLVADGSLVATNAHVAAPGEEASYQEKDCTKLKVGYTTDSDRAPTIFRSANVLKISVNNDLALLKVEDPLGGMDSLELDDQKLNIGDSLTVFGYPSLGGSSITVSSGVISGFDSSEGSDYIKVSAVINSGNSGGPVVGKNGKVIGVASAANLAEVQCAESGDCYTAGQNVSLARPVRQISEWISELAG